MIKFEYQFDENHPKVTVEMSAETSLPDILEQFEAFLRAAGYSFNGNLDIYEEEAHVKP